MFEFLWIGAFTTQLLKRANGWFGQMHTSLVPIDIMILAAIVIIQCLKFNSNRMLPFNLTALIFIAFLPSIISFVALSINDPINGSLTVLLLGSFLPVILLSLSSATSKPTLKSKAFQQLQNFVLYYLGRNLIIHSIFHYQLIFLILSIHKKATIQKLCFLCLMLNLFLPSYQHTTDMTLLDSLFTTNMTLNSHFNLLETKKSLTGRISVVEDHSRFGGLRVMKCDHSLLGGFFLSHANASIFQVFYMMDYVRFIQPKRPKAESNALLM